MKNKPVPSKTFDNCPFFKCHISFWIGLISSFFWVNLTLSLWWTYHLNYLFNFNFQQLTGMKWNVIRLSKVDRPGVTQPVSQPLLLFTVHQHKYLATFNAFLVHFNSFTFKFGTTRKWAQSLPSVWWMDTFWAREYMSGGLSCSRMHADNH